MTSSTPSPAGIDVTGGNAYGENDNHDNNGA
jgi:hypothetical protein